MDHEAAKRAAAIAEELNSTAREHAEKLSAALRRTARALEGSAAIADERADRREQAGRGAEADRERAMALRASDAAERARAQAEQLLEISRVLER
jgi:hypothetical protein